MSVTLYGAAFSTYTRSARMALVEKGVDYTLAPARLRDPAYTALHPYRKMPALDHDGFVVFEANAILTYVDEVFAGPSLTPGDARGRARMHQWMSAFNDFVNPKAVRGVLIPRFVLAPRGIVVDDASVHAAAAAACEALVPFDNVLAHQPWLAGDALSLADLLLAPAIAYAPMLTGADRYTDGLPHLAAWLERVAARPSFAATAVG